MKNPNISISVIIPIYNGRATLGELCDRLLKQFNNMNVRGEIVFVDDNCPQDSWLEIRELCENKPGVRGIKLSRNFGQHPAITAGLDHAEADWYVVMDGDLQDLPEDIPRLYEYAKTNHLDTVIARRAQQDVSVRKQLGSKLFNYTLHKLAGIPANSQLGNFRVFNHNMKNAFNQYQEQMRIFPAIMGQLGFQVGMLDVERPARAEGKSNYNLSKLLALAMDAIISNSIKPMYFLTGFGFAISLLAFAIAATQVIRKLLFGIQVEGWASLMTGIAFFSGIQIFVISFVGIYVGKGFFEAKNRPKYIISHLEGI